ncbi:MAG: hypothetical protein OEV74_09900 [Cyclobacteriaceae bacterium]|nr:hypothetical protein [Cyclobacteriaceae bacterium]MDH4296581.1 hypothetical protein [Cyclobacteriaceae bacterium]MDH5248848.1 hypothetical protein [Cyclobacteriaceae bacterium]
MNILERAEKVKEKARFLLILSFAFGLCFTVPSYTDALLFTDTNEIIHQEETSGSHLPDQQSHDQESSDTDDNSPQDDDTFIKVSTISFFVPSILRPSLESDNSLLSVSANPPFLPPEMHFC